MTPGSVLLFHRSSSLYQLRDDFMGTLFTALIHLCTHSRWNHAALAISRDEYVEATAQGVKISRIGSTTDEVRVVPIVYSDDDDRDEVLAWATGRVGVRYGYLNAFFCGLRTVFPGLQVKQGDTIICSELVAEALERGGWDFGKDSALVSPGDLADAFGVER